MNDRHWSPLSLGRAWQLVLVSLMAITLAAPLGWAQPIDASVSLVPAAPTDPASEQLRVHTRVEHQDGDQSAVSSGDTVLLHVTVSNDSDLDVSAGRLMLVVPLPAGLRLQAGQEQPVGTEVAYSMDGGTRWHGNANDPSTLDAVRLVHQDALRAGESVQFLLPAEVP